MEEITSFESSDIYTYTETFSLSDNSCSFTDKFESIFPVVTKLELISAKLIKGKKKVQQIDKTIILKNREFFMNIPPFVCDLLKATIDMIINDKDFCTDHIRFYYVYEELYQCTCFIITSHNVIITNKGLCCQVKQSLWRQFAALQGSTTENVDKPPCFWYAKDTKNRGFYYETERLYQLG